MHKMQSWLHYLYKLVYLYFMWFRFNFKFNFLVMCLRNRIFLFLWKMCSFMPLWLLRRLDNKIMPSLLKRMLNMWITFNKMCRMRTRIFLLYELNCKFFLAMRFKLPSWNGSRLVNNEMLFLQSFMPDLLRNLIWLMSYLQKWIFLYSSPSIVCFIMSFFFLYCSRLDLLNVWFILLAMW